MAVEQHMTEGILLRQIATLREQLYQLNEAYYSPTGGGGQGGGALIDRRRKSKYGGLTTEEHQLIQRNEALRAEKERLSKALGVKDPPELMDKKNQLFELNRAIEETRKEVEKLEGIKENQDLLACGMVQRQKELQSLRAALNAEVNDYRVMEREMLGKVKEAERRMLAAHSKAVRLNERSKHGVLVSDAEKLNRDIQEQEEVIEELEQQIRRRQRSHQTELIRHRAAAPPPPTAVRAKELQALQTQAESLQTVLASRDAELKRSYDYAARKISAETRLAALAVVTATNGVGNNPTTATSGEDTK